jgi:sodium/proline symporter
MSMVENAWGLFGSAFGPVVILSLFWKRLTYKGAIAGIVAGAVTDIAWLVLFTSTVTTPVISDTKVYEIVPGFIIGAICTVIFTLIDKKPSAEVEAIYANATNPEIND